ncbi:MAG: hypothetical protein JWP89_5593 [Schlesneria sp.]|nr:hypothetical protein [Schlesneria sp.]
MSHNHVSTATSYSLGHDSRSQDLSEDRISVLHSWSGSWFSDLLEAVKSPIVVGTLALLTALLVLVSWDLLLRSRPPTVHAMSTERDGPDKGD